MVLRSSKYYFDLKIYILKDDDQHLLEDTRIEAFYLLYSKFILMEQLFSNDMKEKPLIC